MPRTTELEAEVLRIEDTLAAMDPDDPQRRQYANPLKAARRFLRDGRIRDELQAERPEGCFCLGLGGRGQGFIDAIVSSPDLEDPLYAYLEYCPCPDGRRVYRRVMDYLEAKAVSWKQAAIDRFFGEAQVPPHFHGHTWESYPVSEQTAESFATIRRWASGEPIRGETRKEGLYLHGRTGSGKTELVLCAVRDMLARQPQAVLFIAVPELLERMKRSFSRDIGGSQEPVLKTAEEVPILVLDDIGKEIPTAWAKTTLYTLINHRHNWRLPTFFTSEYKRSQLESRLDAATVWRMVEMAESIELSGPNLRDR